MSSFDRIACVKVRIRARGHFVIYIIKSMNFISMYFWEERETLGTNAIKLLWLSILKNETKPKHKL